MTNKVKVRINEKNIYTKEIIGQVFEAEVEGSAYWIKGYDLHKVSPDYFADDDFNYCFYYVAAVEVTEEDTQDIDANSDFNMGILVALQVIRSNGQENLAIELVDSVGGVDTLRHTAEEQGGVDLETLQWLDKLYGEL